MLRQDLHALFRHCPATVMGRLLAASHWWEIAGKAPGAVEPQSGDLSGDIVCWVPDGGARTADPLVAAWPRSVLGACPGVRWSVCLPPL